MNEQLQGGRRRVLVCGRDEQILQRVAAVLPECQVERASTQQALLAAVELQAVDLVLTSRDTSGAEAVDLVRQIHALEHALERRAGPDAGEKIRVIILTTRSTREDVIAGMRERAFSYFSKPYFEAAFDEILRHAAAGGSWADYIRVDSATSAWLRVIARCEMATADRLVQFMNEVSDLSGKARESMGFALKEILMNAMEYGGQFNPERLVEVSYVRGRRMILYRVRDPGGGFSLEELTHAAISNPPDEPVRHLEVRDAMGIRPGGYGVLLSQKLVDDLIYSEQGNDVLIIKYLDDQGAREA